MRSLISMLGLCYSYRNPLDALSSLVGIRHRAPPVVLDLSGAWLAELVGESGASYYTDYRVQSDVRRRAEAILLESAGLKLAGGIDFGNMLAGSIFGGEVILSDTGQPKLAPVLSSPDDVTKSAARADALSIDKAGLTPRLFEWRRRLKLEQTVFVLRVPGVVTLAEQVCGAENLQAWLSSRPGKIMDLAGALRRTLIRLVQFVRCKTWTPTPFLIIDDPAMGTIDPEVFHEVFWRATRSVVLALTSGPFFRCYRAPGANESHFEYIARLKPRVVQVGESVGLETVRSKMGKPVVWGHLPPSLLRDGKPDRIKSAASGCIEKARALNLPLLLSPSGEVPPGTPLENIVALTIR